MSDLISRAAAKAALKQTLKIMADRPEIDYYSLAVSVIECLPSAGEEIVRCIECENYHPDPQNHTIGECLYWSSGTCAYEFCSYGRNGGEE